MPSEKECKSMIFKLAIKNGVSPKLIASRLLSHDDKQDMLEGIVTEPQLDTAIKCWQKLGMPNYACGNHETYKKDNMPQNSHTIDYSGFVHKQLPRYRRG